MLPASEGLHCPLLLLILLLLLLLLLPGVPADVEDADEEQVEVVTSSSPCSSTCGLGFKTQTLCLLRDNNRATEEDPGSKDGMEVSEVCRVHQVKCQESWQCGLWTLTVTSGQRLQVDCLGDVMKTMRRASWRVSWRFARGIISSDDSLFAGWKSPHLHWVILDPVREEHAGTYRCDVQDGSFRRVKRAYWGVRVLPAGILNLEN